jgi:hypothetical protein
MPMGPVTMMIGGVLAKLAERAGTIIIKRVLDPDGNGNGHGGRTGVRIDPRTGIEPVHGHGRHYASNAMAYPTVTLRGEFIPDGRMLAGSLKGDEIALLLIEEVRPRSTGQIYLFNFELADGYEIDLCPGLYGIYVIVIEPDPVNLGDSEVLALGYPYNLDAAVDPNPLRVQGTGILELDMDIFYPDDGPLFLDDLVDVG